MKVSEIIEDFTIYPRNLVDDVWISELSQHLRSGANFPPVLIDKKSKRLVDGFHRRRAYIRVFGPDCDIPTEVMSFKNDADLFLESMRRNGTHGKPLSTVDRLRCVDRGRAFGLTIEVIASTLNIEPRKLEAKAELRITTGENGESVILKRSMVRPIGPATNDQKRAINAAAGKISFHAKSLYDLLRLNLLDLNDATILQDLYNLRDVLNEKLPEKVEVV